MRTYETLVVLAGVLSSATVVKALSPEDASQNYYYVFDGQSLSLVQRDPTNVSAPKWAAFFFLKGRSTAISNRWGVSEKNTPAEVLKSVESSQQFERSYEKWCGCDWGEETFFNAIAPVAMMDSGKVALDPLKTQLLNKTHDTWDEAQELIEQYNNAAELSGGETLPKVMSGPVAEFLKKMHAVIDQYKSTYEKITQYSDSALRGFETNVDAFAASVSGIEKTAPLTFQALRASGATTTGALTSLAFDEPDEDNSDLIHHYQWSISGSKIIEDYDSNDGILKHIEVPIPNIDLKSAKVYAGVGLSDDGFTLYLRCSTPAGTARTPTCINGSESDNGGDNYNISDVDIYIHCNSREQCEAFLNSVVRAAK